MLTYHCYSELKTQNAFEPILEDGVALIGGNSNPSPAVCQLDDVKAILGSTQTDTTYQMRVGTGDDCFVTIDPKLDSITLNDGDNFAKDGGEDIKSDSNRHCTVTYDRSTGNLKIKPTPTDPSVTQVCEFSEHEEGNDKVIIDTRYLSKKQFGLSLTGTRVVSNTESNPYQIMKDEFYCAVQGSFFKAVSIGCGSGDSTEGFQKKCENILDKVENTVSCKISMMKGAEDSDLLEDITFTIQRSHVQFYECSAGFELDEENGVCEPCEAGKFKVFNTGKCGPCESKQYAPHEGATKCYDCINGYVDTDKTTCTSCKPGQVVNSKGDGCEDCEAGKYQDGTSCQPCKGMKYSLQGSTDCYYCKPGYEVKENNDGCTACYPGEYNNDTENEKCRPCPGSEYTTVLHGQATCDVEIKNEVFCSRGDFDSPAIGPLEFPRVQAGQNSVARCPYNNGSTAVRPCNADGQWDTPDVSACSSKKTETIEKIDVKSESSIEELGSETQHVEEVAPKDMEAVVTKMKSDEVKSVFRNSVDTSIKGLANTSMTVVSNMMAASKSSGLTDQKLKNEIVDCFESVVMLALEHMKNDDAEVDIFTESTDIRLVKDADAAENKVIETSHDIKISLDKDSNIKNLATLIYKDNSAFKQPNATRGNPTIAGKIVGLKHTPRANDTNISFKMKFDFQELKNPQKKPGQKVLKQCKYYETVTNTWKEEGCTTITDAADGSVECECDHMTSFAVILSVEDASAPLWLSNLVLGTNVVFCLLTLLCTLPFRTFRVRKMTIIQSHSILSLCLLCITWFLMQDLDISESKPAYDSVECKAVAFIAHYFLMATFSWIFCCSLTLKSQIVDAVKSFGKKNKNLVKKCVLFGYGFPLLIPSLAFLVDFLMKKYSAEGPEIHYIRKVECWYEDIWMYSFILFPIYVFLIINIVCFIKIMRVIGNARRSNDGSSERRVVKAGFALAFTQGLPWIMHPGALTDGAADVFQYLFLITFGLQGIGLFVFNVLFQEEVLKNLCGLLNVKPPLIFLSVVPSKQRRTPNSQTGETSLGTARNSTGNNDKCYSNNLATYYEDESVCMEDSDGDLGSTGTSRSRVEHINFRSTLNSVATVAVGEKSLYQDTSHYNELHETSLVTEHRSGVDNTYSHLNATKTRELGGSNGELHHRSPIPGETETLEHQGPPLM